MRRLSLTLLASLGAAGCSQAVDPLPQVDLGIFDGGGRDATVPAGDGGPPPPKPARQITLRIDDTPSAPLTLDMNRDEVAELLGPFADDIVLLELDPLPLLRNILNEVKAACGTDWRRDTHDPQFDCEQTALGRSFDAPWARSPEFSLIRVLTMTPANVIVDGTSIDFLQSVADVFGIGGGFAQILSDTLDISVTTEIVSPESVARSLRENLLVTHPNTVNGGRLRVTLRDALSDLATLADSLGPMNGHPGVIDPGTIPHGAVFGPDFRMQVVADSNIRVVEGLKASGGLDNINVLVDTVGPGFNDPLEFDFQDPDRFTISGLVAEPTVDMRFAIYEHDRFMPSCAGDEACMRNTPDSPLGGGSLWSLPPHTLEYITAYAAYLDYGNLRVNNCYAACAITEISIGQNGDPAGWTRFGVPLNLGPQDQYVWEFITEVAQIALHGEDNRLFDEGDVDVKFTLGGVVTGITGEEAAEAARPFLQQQGPALARFILGNFRERSGAVDVYYRRADDGTAMLFFVAPEDLAEGQPYGWARPGFYADAALTEKLSATALPGVADTTHEKLAVQAGEQTVYIEDDAGRRYALRIEAASAGHPSIDVSVTDL